MDMLPDNPAQTFWLLLIIGLMGAELGLGLVVRWLNQRAASAPMPDEFADVFDQERYQRAQAYQRAHAGAASAEQLIAFGALVAVLAGGGLGWLDGLTRRLALGSVWTGLSFFGAAGLAAFLFSLPFSIWRTFRIEERFGFNRTSPRTFAADALKGLLLSAVLGGALLGAVLALFEHLGPEAWWLVWAAVAGFELLVAFVSPALLMPLFYKFVPLTKGELRERIEALADRAAFGRRGIYSVDGSRRSTKANAFFAGFGAGRRIALFDTLIERHPPEEIAAVLAHEMGHAKRRHVLWGTLISLATTGLLCFGLSLVLDFGPLQRGLGFERASVWAGLLAFGLLFSPASRVLGLASAWLSRRFERQADRYAAELTGQPAALAAALKRLAADSLTPLTPHPLKVFLDYSHPPVLERVRRLQAMQAERQR